MRYQIADRAETGYFPRGSSMLRRVHEERLVGLHFGQRALAIGALNPLTFVGTAEHSTAKLRPFKRLTSTGNALETIFFGSCAEADRVLASIHRMHKRVRGGLPEDAGRFAAGTPYSAYDPELMLWTLAVMAESAHYFFELFVRPLEPSESDAFWRDYVRLGELFGMPADVAPAGWRAFRAYWEACLASDDMHLTDEARYMGHASAFEIPMPALHQPAKRVHDLVMLGSLPPSVREHYGLTWTPARAAAFRVAVTAVRAGRAVAPRALAKGYNTRSFKLVASTERGRLERGEPTPGAAAVST
jgi:uncharacterized protein (DUF2236 family)